MIDDNCLFCRIVSGKTDAVVVYRDENVLVFLDHRPLFAGHCLIVPTEHYETLTDLPKEEIARFFERVQLISLAVQSALGAEGTFVAMNNRVSQSVPHLHVHVVPRKKGDGLKGFFWPRTKYKTQLEMEDVANRIADYLAKSDS
jgi:histidine triad (HIT) family protein